MKVVASRTKRIADLSQRSSVSLMGQGELGGLIPVGKLIEEWIIPLLVEDWIAEHAEDEAETIPEDDNREHP